MKKWIGILAIAASCSMTACVVTPPTIRPYPPVVVQPPVVYQQPPIVVTPQNDYYWRSHSYHYEDHDWNWNGSWHRED